MMAHPRLAVLWLLTCLVLLYPVARAWRRPWEMLGLPFVCGFFGLYFYGFMAYQAAQTLEDEIPLWSRELGQAIAIISAIAFYAGWFGVTGKSSFSGSASRQRLLAYQDKLWVAGQILSWAGVAGFIMWRRSGAGFETSAYWYMVPNLVYPGAALCLVSLFSSTANRTLGRWILAATPVIITILPRLLGARRGPVMAFALLAVASVSLGRRVLPARAWVLGGILGTGLVVLAFQPMRNYLVEGSSFTTALLKVTPDEVMTRRTQKIGDNEYAYHCGLVATAYQTGMYQRGTQLLMLLVHWVPRQYWPDKPERGGGLYPSIKGEEMVNVVGFDMGPGMASGGFAYVFVDFGFYAVVFWWAFGWAAAKIYQRAVAFAAPVWCIAWINIYSCAHWLFAQDFAAFFVPMLYAQVAAFSVLYLMGAGATKYVAPARPGGAPRRGAMVKTLPESPEPALPSQSGQAPSRNVRQTRIPNDRAWDRTAAGRRPNRIRPS
jgi:hypothetical protein